MHRERSRWKMDTPRERDEEEAQNINITPVRSTTVQRLQVYLERRMAQRNITTEEQQNTEEVSRVFVDFSEFPLDWCDALDSFGISKGIAFVS